MKVYELSRGEKYEGSFVVGIYASFERAIEGAWKEAGKLIHIYPDDEWTVSNHEKYNFYLTNTMEEYVFVKERELIE